MSTDLEKRVARLEKRFDEILSKLSEVPLLSQKMMDFIERMDRYLSKHDAEHTELKNTDTKLKNYVNITTGVVIASSTLLPLIVSLLVYIYFNE